MAIMQNVAVYIRIDDPDVQTPSTDRYHPGDNHGPLIVSVDHPSIVNIWLLDAHYHHVMGQGCEGWKLPH